MLYSHITSKMINIIIRLKNSYLVNINSLVTRLKILQWQQLSNELMSLHLLTLTKGYQEIWQNFSTGRGR